MIAHRAIGDDALADDLLRRTTEHVDLELEQASQAKRRALLTRA